MSFVSQLPSKRSPPIETPDKSIRVQTISSRTVFHIFLFSMGRRYTTVLAQRSTTGGWLGGLLEDGSAGRGAPWGNLRLRYPLRLSGYAR